MTERDINRYKKISKKPFGRPVKSIKTYVPKPTDIDYQKGFIQRYFIQKTNDNLSPIYEVDVASFRYYKGKPTHKGVTLKWRISGPLQTSYDNEGKIVDRRVDESNRIAIKLVSDRMPNLKLYLPNLLQFHK